MFFNQKLKQLHLEDTYEGQTAFLVGSGRSLTPKHLERLKEDGIFTVGVNEGSHYIKPNIAISQNQNYITISVAKDPTIQKFVILGNAHKNLYEEQEKTMLDYPNVVFYTAHYRKIEDFLKLKDHIYKQLHIKNDELKLWSTSAMCAIHLLYVLGFKTVYLVGVDYYSGFGTNDNTYFFERPVFKKTRESRIIRASNTLNQLGAKEISEEFKVYNTNKRSSLTLEYCDFDEAINKSKIHYDVDLYDKIKNRNSHFDKELRGRLRERRRKRSKNIARKKRKKRMLKKFRRK